MYQLGDSLIFVYEEEHGVLLFDPENNGADVSAFADMWPEAIYFYHA